ncbi:MAG TPA: hypothetical protein VK811_01365 [Candidatus Acidoferrum sp.]|jgi:hypothetical protein|nr:hypothetical protein [Candidatus Acidoferrum sp.]
MSEIRYIRLTRFSFRNPFSNLWLGPDHIMSVRSNGYMETYKRFYFRDIQAVVIQTTSARTIWNIVMVLPLIGCLTGLMASLTSNPQNEVAILIWLILSAMLLLVVLINNVRGPSCACYLRTAVQIERLPSLNRVRKARRVLNRIRPLMAAVQGGELSAEAVATQMREWAVSSSGTAPTTAVPEGLDAPPQPGAGV